MNNSTPETKRRFFNYKTLIGIVISVLGLYLGFRKFDGKSFLNALDGVNLIWFSTAIIAMVVSVWIRAWRWRYLIFSIKGIPVKDLFASTMIGYFGNNVFPLRLGEFLRAYSLGEIAGLSAVSVFANIVVERILDAIMFLLIFVMVIIFVPEIPSWILRSGIIALIIVVIFLILAYVFASQRRSLMNHLKRNSKSTTMERVSKFADHFKEGLLALKTTHYLWLIVIQSIVLWILYIFNIWAVGASLGMFFSIENILLILLVSTAIISVPSAPGYIGTYHAGAIGILVFMGLDLTSSQVMAVVLHSVGFLSLTAIGLCYFLKHHVSIKRVSQLSINSRE